MMAAVSAAERGAQVTLLEPNERLGKKLNITGKGRCNVTNNADVQTLLANVPRNGKFCTAPFPVRRPGHHGVLCVHRRAAEDRAGESGVSRQ
ncbi:NAD(P)/FAD-dependent oxidoreductase [Oscillibacter sp.]|uniref:NAD(P)/FAD-dependent oxidoreductase n=1 Tax=Oscillibacter sp. TaxID=1945593 RepID=UPI00338FD4AF